ncbi:hypothetical protein GPALN_001906 [Globodera pallida]|nr:hypothetical protein GPALN_001906 [Globodera pallida]
MSFSSSDGEQDLEMCQRTSPKSVGKRPKGEEGALPGASSPVAGKPRAEPAQSHRRFKIKRACMEPRRQQQARNNGLSLNYSSFSKKSIRQLTKDTQPSTKKRREAKAKRRPRHTQKTAASREGWKCHDLKKYSDDFPRGTILEHPPNIEFYRNTLEKDVSGTVRPSMMDLVEGNKQHHQQQQQQKQESQSNVEMFRERNVQILEGQQRAVGAKLTWRNQPRRTESDSSKQKSLQVQRRAPRPSADAGGDKMKLTKFGWVQGVLIRCMASIFGVMLYLRLSWVSAQSGLLLGSCIVLLGTLITIITTLSTSAICTNGLVKGGGAYFLISRSLGPEFGGSIGIIFSIANAVGAAMYLVRPLKLSFLDGDINDIRIIALVACAILVVIILVGLSFESKMQILMMVLLWVSILDYFIGTFIPPSEEQQRKGITGFRMETLKENLMPQFRDDYNFFTVFAVYFPAATGIMAGANISGDLRDPQSAIPLGTLVAIAITSTIYLLVVWLTGSTVVRDSDGLNVPLLLMNASREFLFEQISSQSVQLVSQQFNDSLSTNSPPMAHQIETLSSSPLYYAPPQCAYNQSSNCYFAKIVELGSAWGPLVTVGIIASTLSSALVSLAVCRDRLFPYINRFGRGHGPNDDPRQALFLVAAIAVAVILIGNLNLIAPLISNFFLCSYALINYACFDNSFAHSPGFRPSFKYYNKWVSLVGSLMCVFCMFIISWWMALLTFFFFVTIYMYVAHRKPDVNWGSSGQAHSYRNALQYVSKLERTEEHVKNYRPQLMVLTGNPAARAGLVDFAYSITKGSSLLMCGYVIPYKACNTVRYRSRMANHCYRIQVFMMMQRFNQQLRDWFVVRHMKAFAVTVANPNLRSGVQSLLQIAGLGKLRPNIILMGFKSNWTQPKPPTENAMTEINDYFGLIQDAFDLNMSVAVLRNSAKGLDISEFILETTEDLCQHQRQLCASSRRGSYPTEQHPSQQLNTAGVQLAQLAQQPAAAAAVVPFPTQSNARQRARDLLLRAIGQRERTTGWTTLASIGGLTVQSTVGGLGEDTLQTTVGQAEGDTMGGTTRGWLANSDTVTRKGSQKDDTGAEHLQLEQQFLPPLPLPSDALRFQTRVRHGTIDVWWLYDDGGLTLLIPYLLAQQKSYLENAKLRVFTLAGQGKNLQHEHQGLATMLKKFRITADQVNVIPDFTSKRPDAKSLAKFDALIKPFMSPIGRRESNMTTVQLESDDENVDADVDHFVGLITEAELNAQQERTWRHLRIAELLRRYSSDSDLVVVTLPVPRRGLISAALYLAWLEVMSAELPPTLMLRGNQQSVLTFYS